MRQLPMGTGTVRKVQGKAQAVGPSIGKPAKPGGYHAILGIDQGEGGDGGNLLGVGYAYLTIRNYPLE